MGVFLAGPLADELQRAAEAGTSKAGVRAILEVIVPLAYRPAVKVTCPVVT